MFLCILLLRLRRTMQHMAEIHVTLVHAWKWLVGWEK